MWKKDDESGAPTKPQGASTAPVGSGPAAAPPATGAPAGGEPATRSHAATIGPSITIKGEVSGDEDLLIQGRIDGSVDLGDHAVTVGSDGRVKADITGRIVTVEGEVEGDLRAEEQIILRRSARVEGDMTAPRVVLEDGARFRGLVDMGEREKGKGISSSSGKKDDARSSTGGSGSREASSGGDEGRSKEGKDKEKDRGGAGKPGEAKAAS